MHLRLHRAAAAPAVEPVEAAWDGVVGSRAAEVVIKAPRAGDLAAPAAPVVPARAA